MIGSGAGLGAGVADDAARRRSLAGARALALIAALAVVPVSLAEVGTPYARDVEQGRQIVDGRWIDAPFRVIYVLDPPSIRLGSFVLGFDDELFDLIGFQATPPTVDVGDDALFDRRRHRRAPAVPEAGREIGGVATRIAAFLLGRIHDGAGAAAVSGALGRFFLNDPAVVGAEIEDGIARLALDLDGEKILGFPVPDEERLQAIDRHVRGRLDEVDRAAREMAWLSGGRRIAGTPEPARSLIDSLVSAGSGPGRRAWLLRVLTRHGGVRPGARALDSWSGTARDGTSPPGLPGLHPSGARGIDLVRAGGGAALALACREAPLADVLARIAGASAAPLDTRFRDRSLPVTYYSLAFESLDTLLENLAGDNALDVESQADAGRRVAAVDAIVADTYPVIGTPMWESAALLGSGDWIATVPPVVIQPGPDGGIRSLRWRDGEPGWSIDAAPPSGPPVLGPDGRVVFVGELEGGLYAVRVTDGRISWGLRPLMRLPTLVRSVPAVRPVAIVGSRLLVARGADLLLVDPGNGALRQRLTRPPAGLDPPRQDIAVFAVPDALIAVDGGGVVAMRPGAYRSGGPIRRIEGGWAVAVESGIELVGASLAPGRILPVPAGAVWDVVGDHIVIAGPGPEAVIRRSSDGVEIDRLRLRARPSALVAHEGRALIACRDGWIYRLDPGGARVEARLPGDVPPGAIMATRGPALFHPTYGARLVAIRPE